MDIGSIHESNNFGFFEVIRFYSWRKVKVKFVDTGFVTHTTARNVNCGIVKDKMKPTVCGVGFIGDGDYLSGSFGRSNKRYNVWSDMLSRCYNKKTQEKQPTYKECSVSPIWHNYQNFAAWYELNSIGNGEDEHLDKDIKINGNKIYSPDNCLLVTRSDNNIKSHAKQYTLKSPCGDHQTIYNLKEFCLIKGLTYVCMHGVVSGRQKSHKGWTI